MQQQRPSTVKINKDVEIYGPNRSRIYSEKVERIHRKTVQKDLHDPDNHDGVISHQETHILECKVKWVPGNITTNKDSGSDGTPVGIF